MVFAVLSILQVCFYFFGSGATLPGGSFWEFILRKIIGGLLLLVASGWIITLLGFLLNWWKKIRAKATRSAP